MRHCDVSFFFLPVILLSFSKCFAGKLAPPTIQALHVQAQQRYEGFLKENNHRSCFIRDKGNTTDEVVANTVEPFPDMRRSLPLLANRSILFVGDSLMQNQYVALAALLWEADTSCVSHCKGSEDHCSLHSARWNFTIALHWTGRILETQPRRMRDNIDKKILSSGLVGTLSNQKPDIAMFSTAHHWTKYFWSGVATNDGSQIDVAVLRAAVRRINTLLTPFSKHTRIVWRAVPPRHYVGGDWNTGGTCSRRTPLTLKEVVSFLAYEPESNLRVAMDISAMFREEALKSGFEFLDILPSTLHRADAILGLFSVPGRLDCTHYCVPGVPDVWNAALLDMIRI